jgi:hypothetical protein
MRHIFLLTVRVLVSGLLRYFAVRGIHLNGLWSRLAGTNLAWFVSWILLAILANLIQVFLGSMRAFRTFRANFLCCLTRPRRTSQFSNSFVKK